MTRVFQLARVRITAPINREGRAHYPGDSIVVRFDEAAALIEDGLAVPDGFIGEAPTPRRRVGRILAPTGRTP